MSEATEQKVHVVCRGCWVTDQAAVNAMAIWNVRERDWEVCDVVEEAITCGRCDYIGEPRWLNEHHEEIRVCLECLEWRVHNEFRKADGHADPCCRECFQQATGGRNE